MVPNFPQDLSLEIDRLGREIGIFWHKEQYAEAEALFKQQYTLIRKTEEKKLHEGQRFHKGSYLHSWGLSILWQKKLDRVEEGSRKIFLAYVEDLLDFKTIDEVRGAAAYNALVLDSNLKGKGMDIAKEIWPDSIIQNELDSLNEQQSEDENSSVSGSLDTQQSSLLDNENAMEKALLITPALKLPKGKRKA